MKLEPLYRAEFGYPEAWAVDLEGAAAQRCCLRLHRRGAGLDGSRADLVLDVAELVWEPVAD